MYQSLSIRVPWQDNGWSGKVCCNPHQNQACRVLKNIARVRADIKSLQCESSVGKTILPNDIFVPPCLVESGQFMSDHEMSTMREHPYADKYPQFSHIRKTSLSIMPYSFTATPFRWTLKGPKEQNDSPNSRYYTGYNPDIEFSVTKSDSWITNGANQRRIFEYFYRDVTPNKSLIIAYAKAVPFIETSGRIVIGIGFVKSIGELRDYDYFQAPTDKQVTACLWERNIGHSIRNDRDNGFLFPFAEIQNYLKENPEQNPEDLIVIAPEEYREEFSYAAEHLSHDALIQTLNKTILVLERYKEIGLPYGNGADWEHCIQWCQAQLEKIWEDRGVYPGLGAVLSALGVPFGFDVALALKREYSDDKLWDNLGEGLNNLSLLLPTNQRSILKRFTRFKREDIIDEIEESDYIELLSRITLSLSQAQLLLDNNVRTDPCLTSYADQLTDIHTKELSASIVENPYLLYEKTYRLEDKYQIGVGKIDLAMFPPKSIFEKCWTDTNKCSIQDVDDPRRLRAIITSILENDSANGNSFMIIGEVVGAVAKYRSDVPDIEPDIRLRTIQSNRRKCFFNEMFIQFPIKVILENGEEQDDIALQLTRVQAVNDVIRTFVDNRIEQVVPINEDWSRLLDTALKKEQQSAEEQERMSRDEKVAAIAKMAQSRISVLTGGAGTGKTTTLVALCLSQSIQTGGILVLAPTGKARVVLSSKLREQGIRHEAKTIFQFLMRTRHCNATTYTFYLSGKQDSETPDTVIVDECSMLTEDMFGALAEAVQGARRVIFIGDPSQLPPIGTGKPFYELVQKLKFQEAQPHYANLLISNRQKKRGDNAPRLDLEFSKLFAEDSQSDVGEDLFSRILKDNANIEFVYCKDAESLPKVVEETLAKIDIIDVDSFDSKFGGVKNVRWMNFSDAQAVENWQILTPFHNKEIIGTSAINAFIQSCFRLPKPESHRNTPYPLGKDGIRYGEKVINLQNQDRNSKRWQNSVWSRFESIFPIKNCEKYIANGEIGIVCELSQNGSASHVVQFSSQKGYNYNFFSGVSDEDPSLELAYALTVHKSQGSGFKTSIFILIEPEHGVYPLVTREMLYTALTRQKEKVFLIYNKQPSELRKYMSAEYSDLANRKTNLFGPVILRQLRDRWFDRNLIHVTADGTQVRSKSEVIVYNLLLESNMKPLYERELQLGEITVHPDFTLETPRGTIYWEHLGMLGNYGYNKDWERKKMLYAKYGISEQTGKLVVSQDDINGSIDSVAIKKLIDRCQF